MRSLKVLMLCLVSMCLTGCFNRQYVGYWCNFEEKETIRIEMKENYSTSNKKKIEKLIGNFAGLVSYDFIPGSEFSDSADGDAADTFLIYFDSYDLIDEYVITIDGLNGVDEVYKDSIKTNVSLYEFVNGRKFKLQDALGIDEDLKVSGTYKIKDDTIEVNRSTKTDVLYIKNGYLCGDSGCNMIYSKTDNMCNSIEE